MVKFRFEDRDRVPHDEFVGALGLDVADGPIAIAIREVIAARCGAAAETIYVSDATDMLAGNMLHWFDDGFDPCEFFISLEKRLGTKLDMDWGDLPRFDSGRFFWKVWPGAASLGDWVKQVAPMIRAAM